MNYKNVPAQCILILQKNTITIKKIQKQLWIFIFLLYLLILIWYNRTDYKGGLTWTTVKSRLQRNGRHWFPVLPWWESAARVSFIRVLFVSLIALCIAVTCLGMGSFRGVIDTAPDVDDIDIMPLGYATFLYDDAGNQIRKLAAPDSNRLPVTLDRYLLICSMQCSQLRMNVSMNITVLT